MPPHPPARNRGPAAAPANRAAILTAARSVFAEQGYRAPLSAIAKAAGVGQGVLYRHFPDRLSLAYQVFADNFERLERVAATAPGPDCFGLVWRTLLDDLIDSTAMVEMVIDQQAEVPEPVSESRLLAIVAEPLERAQAAGLADPRWTPDDVLLLVHMVHGVVMAWSGRGSVHDAVRRALNLVDPRLTDGWPQDG